MDDNPYAAPSSAACLAHESRRPVGVAILSILAGILGLVLLAAFVVLVVNWRENNEFALARRIPPSLFYFFSASTAIMAGIASYGMWRGSKWGWWLACYGLVSLIIQNAGLTLQANLSPGPPSVSTFVSIHSLKFVVRGTSAVFILAYWLRKRVMTHFRLERTNRFIAITVVAISFIVITTAITILFQSIHFYRMRRAASSVPVERVLDQAVHRHHRYFFDVVSSGPQEWVHARRCRPV